MANSRSYISNWEKIFVREEPASMAMLKPGNFYKIEVYKYVDGVTRILSGTKTSHIFLIGKFAGDKGTYFSALKLKGVNPSYFFEDIKLMLSPNPMTKDKIDETYDNKNPTKHQFNNFLMKVKPSGDNLFDLLKTKKRIYKDNYREYIGKSIKSVSYLEINEQFLKLTITKNSKKTKNLEKEKDMLNPRKTNNEE